MGFLATTTSISDLLPNYLVGNTTTSDAAGVAIFSRHIDRAEAFIMSSIINRYDPTGWTTTTYPPMLRQLAEDIASYWAIRGASTQDSKILNANLENFKMAFETLSMISEGKLSLAFTNGSLAPSRSSGHFLSSSDGYSPTFNLDTESAWALDEDRSDDIEDGR